MQSLEELLLQTKLVSPAQLKAAKDEAEMRHKRLAPVLIDLGIIDERLFAQWMAQITRLPIIDPLPGEAVWSLVRRVPRAIAREYEVVPVAISERELTIATINPLDAGCIEVLETTTGMPVRCVIALYGPLAQMVARHYPEDDAEATLLPQSGVQFVDGAGFGTVEIGLETLSASATAPFASDERDELGSTTRLFPPNVGQPIQDTGTLTSAPQDDGTQLDRMERQLAALMKALQQLEARIDAMDATLARVLSR